LSSLAVAAHAQYWQDNLVSDGSVPAAFIDTDLQNPWGLAASATSPIWISDQVTNLSTLYSSSGSKLGLTVSVAGGPTGIVFNTAGGFDLGSGKASSFIFDSLAGQILGWAGGTSASVLFNGPSADSSYTGLGILGNDIYAADNGTGNVDVFNDSTGYLDSFTDPTLTGLGFTPFGVQAVGSDIFVTYAPVSSSMTGGYVDEFDANGNLVMQMSGDGWFDCPWGVALAPSDFGQFSGDLLIGNNDAAGWINAFDPTTGAYVGTLSNGGTPLSNDGLWGISFGNGAGSGPSNVLYFTAGPNDAGGLYGSISSTPSPAAGLPLIAGFLGGLARRRRRSR
jgi:uncharacterized protein (TIGR03118 family)